MVYPKYLPAALLAAACAMSAGPALAQYGAIAWDRETGKYGANWNQGSQKGADEVALSDCGATGCKVIIRPGRAKCAALATNEGDRSPI